MNRYERLEGIWCTSIVNIAGFPRYQTDIEKAALFSSSERRVRLKHRGNNFRRAEQVGLGSNANEQTMYLDISY